MSTKEAADRALNKYYENNRKIGINVSNEVYSLMENYCRENGLSKREFIEAAVQFYVDNH